MSGLAQTQSPDLVEATAAKYNLDVQDFWNTISQMCGSPKATRENLIGLLLQAQKLGLDPMAKQLYLMDTGRGVQIVIPVDGYLRLMRRAPDYLHHTIEDNLKDGRPYSATVTIYTKAAQANSLPPFKHTEYFAECRGGSKPWQSHPIRMLRHKAISQAVRACFAIYMADDDEWDRAAEVASGALPERPAASGLAGLMARDVEAVRPGELPDIHEEPPLPADAMVSNVVTPPHSPSLDDYYDEPRGTQGTLLDGTPTHDGTPWND